MAVSLHAASFQPCGFGTRFLCCTFTQLKNPPICHNQYQYSSNKQHEKQTMLLYLNTFITPSIMHVPIFQLYASTVSLTTVTIAKKGASFSEHPWCLPCHWMNHVEMEWVTNNEQSVDNTP